ncbi:MAG TPA: CBS domain-containing protein [Polyangiaceae bacterium]|nr:CBS domain-containing protein [Polyangiaceae bacterium]
MTNSIPCFVRDIMTRKVAVLYVEQNLELAEWGMKELRFRHLPVVEGNRLIGLVSERDLLRASVSTLNSDHALLDDNLKRYFFVCEVMTTDVITVRPDATLLEAAKLMHERKLGCLPVTEEGGILVGILTQSDLVALLAQFLQERAANQVSGSHAVGLPPRAALGHSNAK